MLTVEKGPGKGLDQIISSLVKAEENFQVLSNKKLKEKFPELSFSPHYSAVLETSAGVLKADKCLRVLQVSEKVFEGLCLSYFATLRLCRRAGQHGCQSAS